MDYAKIRDELDNCKRPLFFYHDDPDGLCSFLLLYRYIQEGKGVVIKTNPQIDVSFLRRVDEYEPDKIFIVDIAIVDQEFLDKVKVPVVHIDHHDVLNLHGNYQYFNSKLEDGIPASEMCYNVVKQDMWIATVGTCGDWTIPHFFEQFKLEYPDLVVDCKTPEDVLFNSKLGKLIKIFAFILKGKVQDVNKAVKYLAKIKTPYEILEQQTDQGKYLYEKAAKLFDEYNELLERAKKQVTDDKFVHFEYTTRNTSFTGDLCNEMMYLYPKKVIIIARQKSGEMKMSVRGYSNVKEPLLRALVGINGRGGGHDNACGCVVDQRDYEKFLEQFRNELN